ncbi:MAG: hypothetical protein J4N83_05605 [Chloroflexi bacterium]|nr:hypothetical protein [Chloroflexota bacterium]
MPTLEQLEEQTKVAEELWMTTRRPDGGSASYPLWFVLDGQRLYILAAESSSEVSDVKQDSRVDVAIGAVDSPDRLAMIADVMEEESWVPMMIDLLQKKYAGAHAERMDRTSQAAQSGHVIIKLKPAE